VRFSKLAASLPLAARRRKFGTIDVATVTVQPPAQLLRNRKMSLLPYLGKRTLTVI
jgi:hypothetical protein